MNLDGGRWFNLERAVRRGDSSKCSACAGMGATLGCLTTSCRMNFHVPCAKENTSWTMRDAWGHVVPFYCDRHRPKHRGGKRPTAAVWPEYVPLDRTWLLGETAPSGIGTGLPCSRRWAQC